jgi:hypothetical protein
MFMAMADIVAAFREAHTEIENIFYETLPPGMALRQRVTDMYSFDSYSGILFSPYPAFLQASLRSRTVGFPESGSGRGLYSHGLSKESEA